MNIISAVNRQLIPDIASTIGTSFCELESLVMHLQIKSVHFKEWTQNIIKSCINDNLSFYIAKDGEIASCVIAEIYDPNRTVPYSTEVKPLHDLMYVLESKVPNYVLADGLTVHVIMCASDVNNKNKGQITELCYHIIEQARSLGAKYMIVEAINLASQHIFLDKLGFDNLYELEYSDYEMFNGFKGTAVLGVKHL